MSSADSHLGLLNSIVHSAERLCEGELCCLEHRRKSSALCLLYKIYDREDHPRNKYLNSVAALNTRALPALGELALVIPCCRTDQFSRSFLPAAELLWNFLPSGVLSGDLFISFKSAMNLCLLRA